jgi:hypothetical protein
MTGYWRPASGSSGVGRWIAGGEAPQLQTAFLMQSIRRAAGDHDAKIRHAIYGTKPGESEWDSYCAKA